MTAIAKYSSTELQAASNALEAAGWHVQPGSTSDWIIWTRTQQGLAIDNEGLVAAVPLITARPDMTDDDLITALSVIPRSVQIAADAFGLRTRIAGPFEYWIYWPHEESDIGKTPALSEPFDDGTHAREWICTDGATMAAEHAPDALAVRAVAQGLNVIDADDEGRLHVVSLDDDLDTEPMRLTPAELEARLAALDDETPPAEAPLVTVAELDARAAVAAATLAPIDGAPVLVDLLRIDDNPWQPRLVYDPAEIAELAAAIAAEGLLQPPAARLTRAGRYQLAFGHRRRRAFALLAAQDDRYQRMPLYLRDLDDEAMVRQAWRENRDRKDLTSYEDAVAIQRYQTEFGWTQAQVAEKLGLDRSTVANKLRLLKLPQPALDQLRAGTLTERQAMALLPLADLPPAVQASPKGVWAGNTNLSITGLFQQAGQLDSGTLRGAVERLVEAHTIALVKRPWATVDTGATPVHAALCKDCPIRLKHSNRCPDLDCAGRKEEGFARQQAAAGAASLKLPAVARPAGSSPYANWCDGLQGVQRSAIKDMAAEKQCGNLGVVYQTEQTWGLAHKLEKYPHCYLVCAHGEGKRCACKMALARQTDRPEASAQAQARVDKKRIKAELIGPAETTIASLLTTPTAATWRALLGKLAYGSGSKVAPDADTPTVLAAIAAVLVREAIKYHYEYGTPSYAKAREALQKLCDEIGALTPWPADEPVPPPADVRAQTLPATPAGDDAPALGTVGWIGSQLTRIEAAITLGSATPAMADELAALGEDLENLVAQLDDATYENLSFRIDSALEALPDEESKAA